MWGTAALGETKKRTLEQPDIDGFKSLYGGSPSIGAPVLMAPANGSTGVSTTPTLSWNAVSGATSYDVYFGSTASPALVGTVSTTTYQPGTLAAGAAYYWRVVAKNASGSATSATFSFTTAGGTMAGPVLISPANGATGVSVRPVMQWTAVAGAGSYDLYVGTSSFAVTHRNGHRDLCDRHRIPIRGRCITGRWLPGLRLVHPVRRFRLSAPDNVVSGAVPQRTVPAACLDHPFLSYRFPSAGDTNSERLRLTTRARKFNLVHNLGAGRGGSIGAATTEKGISFESFACYSCVG